jgi:hypothetical protein
VRTLEEADGGLAVRRTDHAPASARGDRRDKPTLASVGVDQ